MDIIITVLTQEIIRQNKCQMRLLDKLLLKQNFDQKLIINAINCSVLDYKPTSDYDEMDNCVYKSTVLEYTMKHLMKETSLSCGA